MTVSEPAEGRRKITADLGMVTTHKRSGYSYSSCHMCGGNLLWPGANGKNLKKFSDTYRPKPKFVVFFFFQHHNNIINHGHAFVLRYWFPSVDSNRGGFCRGGKRSRTIWLRCELFPKLCPPPPGLRIRLIDIAQVIIECSGFPPALQQVALLLLGTLVALLQCFNC